MAVGGEEREVQQLAERALAGELSPGDQARLETLLLESRRARIAYVRYISMVSGLRRYLSEENSETPDIEAIPEELVASTLFEESQSNFEQAVALGRPWAEKQTGPDENLPASHRRFASRHLPRWSLVAGGILLALAVIGIRNFRDAEKLSPVVASLREDLHCRWKESRSPVFVNSVFRSGQRLDLLDGTATFTFGGGAVVVIEGPSSFEFRTQTSMRLLDGTVVVRANGPEKNFIVETPDATIVDLGTSFGVHCNSGRVTDVEVFEGVVEIRDHKQQLDQVLEMGGSARIRGNGGKAAITSYAPRFDRFGNLLERLWPVYQYEVLTETSSIDSSVIQTDFSDASDGQHAQTLEIAGHDHGWLTPWLASGNPRCEIRVDEPLIAEGDPYLNVSFQNSYDRMIAREYGSSKNFDPLRPHVISWRWRMDPSSSELGDTYDDRVHFYGNPYYRRNSWLTNSWLIGVVRGHETVGRLRQVYPNHWYVFDATDQYLLEAQNLIDTGMELKQGVTYEFTITVYPQQAEYDVAIADDERSFSRKGLKFRNRTPAGANVLHFGHCTSRGEDVTSFSLDAIRIEPLSVDRQ